MSTARAYNRTAMAFLEARGLSKTYRNAEVPVGVFGGLTLGVERGEMLAVVGPSGIGKSTLLHLLGGLDRPDGGTIEIAGRELTTMTNDELARWRNRSVGFVFQFHHLLPEFSALENAVFDLSLDEIVANGLEADVIFLAQVGEKVRRAD